MVVSPEMGLQKVVSSLLDDFDGAFWALHLACATDKTVVNVYWRRLSVFHFVNTNWTGVDTCFASSAFCYIDFDFNHYLINSAFRF